MREKLNYAYLGNGVGITRTHRGHRIFVYTKDFGLTPHIILDGIWEYAIEHTILKLINLGSTVIEIGCNMGYHTLAMCERIGSKGQIFGFEVNPEIFELLKWSVDYNNFLSFAKLFNHAVTETVGDVTFGYTPSAVGGGNVITNREAITGETVITVHGEPLDIILPDLSNVDLIRMDAEGFEPFIIKGAHNIIQRSPSVRIVSEWSVPMMSARTDVSAFVGYLKDLGFGAYKIQGDSSFTPVADDRLLDIPHCEICFSRDVVR